MGKTVDFSKVCILGMGMMGTSLFQLILKKTSSQVFGIAGEEYIESVKESQKNILEEYGNRSMIVSSSSKEIGNIVQSSDLIILASNISGILVKLREVAALLKDDAVTIDLGSTKEVICEDAKRLGNDFAAMRNFVGCHPMAGSDERGPIYASDKIYSGKSCFVMNSSSVEHRQRVVDFWDSLGVSSILTSPKEHDKLVARISHLPRAIASTMIHLLTDDEVQQSAGGLLRLLRAGGSNPQMWKDIFLTNKRPIIEAISNFKEILSQLEAALEEDSQALESRLIKEHDRVQESDKLQRILGDHE